MVGRAGKSSKAPERAPDLVGVKAEIMYCRESFSFASFLKCMLSCYVSFWSLMLLIENELKDIYFAYLGTERSEKKNNVRRYDQEVIGNVKRVS